MGISRMQVRNQWDAGSMAVEHSQVQNHWEGGSMAVEPLLQKRP